MGDAKDRHSHYSPICLPRSTPHIDSLIILEAKKAVDRLNNESRLTFALLADLSTFIHVADVLRIDFRGGTLRGRWF